MEVADKWIKRGYPVRKVLRIVGVSEQIYYYRKKNKDKVIIYRGGRPIPGYSLNEQGRPVSDLQIKEWLMELASGEEAVYGYRKLTVCLRKQYQLLINKKKVYRLCQELGLLQPQRKKRDLRPKKIARNREITGSNQLWELDVKYGFIAGEQRFFFLLSLMDVYDRSIVDYHIGLTCEGAHAVQAIQRALFKRQLYEREHRPVLRTDNGPQFICHAFEQFCEAYGLEHERIPPKTPNKNAHIESFHSALEKECLTRHEFETYQQAYQVVTDYIDFYNKRRIHGSLFDLAPLEFIQAVKQQKIKPVIVRV
jgi:putative transposase